MNLLDPQDLPQSNDSEDILNKWKDKPLEEVLKAKVNADLHIKALEREKAELREMYLSQREELLAKAKFEEYIDQIRTPKQDLQVANTTANEVNSPKYDPKEIENLVLSKIQEAESNKVSVENFRKVQSKLKERYGDNYVSVLKDQQDSLGLSQDEINNLAKRSPEAFFRVMGLNEKNTDPFQSPPRSGQRNDSFAPRGAPKRDYNYYQELKKTNPKLYLDPKISLQMEKDAQELGMAFFPD